MTCILCIHFTVADGGADISKDYSKAIEEMMKRIKQGKFGLKAVEINKMVFSLSFWYLMLNWLLSILYAIHFMVNKMEI